MPFEKQLYYSMEKTSISPWFQLKGWATTQKMCTLILVVAKAGFKIILIADYLTPPGTCFFWQWDRLGYDDDDDDQSAEMDEDRKEVFNDKTETGKQWGCNEWENFVVTSS